MEIARNYHPVWNNPIPKEHTWYAITDKWVLAQKLWIPKIQFTDHKKLKKKEEQSVNTLILTEKWIKIPMAYSQPIEWA